METLFYTLGDNVPSPISGELLSDADKHRRLIDQAVAAEAGGFDVLQLGEHHFNHFVFSAPEVILAAVAQHTKTLRLGTAVTTITTLDPVRVAETFSTVDLLSNGRAEIAVGRGAYAATFEAMGRPQDQVAEIFEESTTLLWRLLNETNIDWDGSWRSPLAGITIRPRPIQQPIPLWIGSTSAIDLAVRLGSGVEWVCALTPVSALVPAANRYHEAWSATGRETEAGKIRLFAPAHVARTSQEAHRAFLPYFVNAMECNARLARPGSKPKVDRNTDFRSIVSQDPAEKLPFCGSPEEVVDRIGNAAELLGLSGIGLMLDVGGMTRGVALDQIETVSSTVLPKVRTL